MIDDKTRAFLLSRRVARLATVDEHGRPHVVPICFALDGDVLYTAVDEARRLHAAPPPSQHRR